MSNLPEDERIAILEDEKELLNGLLAAADFKNDDGLRKLIRINRNGRLYFAFRICPISDEEATQIRRNHTRYYDNPRGANLPKIPGETDEDAVIREVIYKATIKEDRARVWDNPEMKNKLQIINGADAVNLLLLPGEIETVHNEISKISGYGAAARSEMLDFVKN